MVVDSMERSVMEIVVASEVISVSLSECLLLGVVTVNGFGSVGGDDG